MRCTRQCYFERKGNLALHLLRPQSIHGRVYDDLFIGDVWNGIDRHGYELHRSICCDEQRDEEDDAPETDGKP